MGDNSTESRTTQESRLLGLMRGLRLVAKLQERLTNTQVDCRQKRREAALKREAVGDCDAKFMKKIQELVAHGQEGLREQFEQLERLADACQAARDDLGPVEQEGIDAEQNWEGQVWCLREAENQVYAEFESEFCIAASYSAQSLATSSSQYELHSERGNDLLYNDSSEGQLNRPLTSATTRDMATAFASSSIEIEQPRTLHTHMFREPVLLGLKESDESDARHIEGTLAEWNSSSGIADLDRATENWITGAPVGIPQPLPDKHYASDLYSNLLTDFGSKRDRVNQWLEHTALVSRMEATSMLTILRDELESESKEVPSNWSQLVVAYWELDGAATLHQYSAQSHVYQLQE